MQSAKVHGEYLTGFSEVVCCSSSNLEMKDSSSPLGKAGPASSHVRGRDGGLARFRAGLPCYRWAPGSLGLTVQARVDLDLYCPIG